MEVRTAADAGEAPGALDGFAPDLVKMDTPITTPDGRELLHSLHDRSRRLGAVPPVIVAVAPEREPAHAGSAKFPELPVHST